jgi:peptidoglycan/LPS O-acetylase OafA/YrhL
LGLTFAALIAAFFTSFGVSYVTEEHVEIYRNFSPERTLRVYSTYHRITPWLIGFILGYFLHKYQHLATFQKLEELRNRRVTWRKTLLAVLISAICIVLFCGPILAVHPFLQPDYQYDAFASAAYRSLSHVIFALSVVLAVGACITGYGGLLDMLFSWKFYVPISRLTYSIYLIHMTIVQSYVYSKMTPGYISDSNMIMAAVPIALLTLILSALLYLMVEQPVVTLERLLLRRQDPESPALLVIQSRDGGHKSPSCEIPDITPGNVPNGHIRQPVGDEYTLSVVDLRI